MRGAKTFLMVSLIALASCNRSPEQPDNLTENVAAVSPPPKVEPEWITTEQLIQSDFGNSAYPLHLGATYRIVGKVRNISVAEGGLPQIQFTAFSARLANEAAQTAKDIDADSYVAVSCVYKNRDDTDSGLILKDCTDLQPIDTVSAESYADLYQGNAFKADGRFKDNYIVIFGNAVQQDKLIDGQDYVDLEAQKDFSSVTAILSPEARAMNKDHAKIGELTVMLCVGGYSYNEAGSIGVKDCKYLQNY